MAVSEMDLEFGVFDHLDRNDLPLRDLYEQRLKVIEAFDRSGFYAYHVAEHHFTPLGMAPSPSVFLSAVGQRTQRLRFGTFVYALPVHHPLRVFEEICMLDHLSGGRLEIGFGRGSVPFEISYYGQNAQERQEIYAERLELILKAFTVRTLTWHGRYDRFENVPMEFAPLQQPHPPLWYGAHSPDSAERAARKGLNIVTNDMPDNARAIVDRYRRVWRETQNSTAMPKMGIVRFIIVADSDAAALAIARRAYVRWRASFVYLSARHGELPDSPMNVENFDQLIRQGQAIAGSAETVRAFLAGQIEDSKANYLVGQFCFGDLTLEEMLRSVGLFSAHVMPALQTAFKN
jgi:alkanesulfonate monooxygenase SsuD/methylene tetrahydromethanopterin reductase-like flavin-dependent oxidoreductase (luciferase family)